MYQEVLLVALTHYLFDSCHLTFQFLLPPIAIHEAAPPIPLSAGNRGRPARPLRLIGYTSMEFYVLCPLHVLSDEHRKQHGRYA